MDARDTYAGTLPATKFAPPDGAAGFVPRSRLLDRLDDAISRPLTLLAAPPGSGKTALLGSWVAAGRAPGPVAWLSLDAADGDRRRFWRAVLEALARVGVGVPPPERVEHFADALVGALARRRRPAVLVLDDFDEVADAVHGELALLLRRPPAALRLVIATRADPPLPLGRLRMQDQLAEIRAADLALTPDETRELLAALSVELSDDAALSVWERTEGWVGAVRLAALSLRGHPEPERFVEDFAGDDHAVSDYLLSEVLARQSADTRCFLLRTSIVSVLNGDLADALTGRSDGRRVLAELARTGTPIAPLDTRGEWYRYHSLFAELLRAELRSQRPEQVPELHRRAAEWLARHGDDAGALLHAIDGEAWDLAAHLAGDRWVRLLIQGEIGVLEAMLDRMPRERVLADPELALAVASTLLDRGDAAAGDGELRRAEAAALRVPPARRARFNVSLAAVRLGLARLRGDLEAAVRAGRDLVRGGELEHGAVEADLRALALVNLGVAELWAGDAGAAGRHLEHAKGAATDAGRDWLVLMAGAHLAVQALVVYDYPRVARQANEAIALAQRRGWERTWPAGAAYAALGGAQFLWDRLADAAISLERAQEALAGTRERPLRAALAIIRAGVLGVRGEPETALAVLGAGEEQLGDWPAPPELREQFAVLEALLRAEVGDPGRAREVLESGDPSLERGVALASLALGGGDPAAAMAALAPWREQLEREATPTSVQGWVFEALALEALGDRDGADEALARALEGAEPGGLRRPLMSVGRTLEPLLRRQLDRGTAHRALVDEQIAALGSSAGRPRSPFVVEALSPRELAVLRYLPTMMSNEEIAAELYVSVNTVKTHLKAIYRKLDVPGRREAIRRARMLELLAP